METVITQSKKEIKEALKTFERKHEYLHQTRHGTLTLSEGCKYLKIALNADWLYNLIIKHQELPEMKHYKVQLWTWEQTKVRTVWTLKASTGNRTTLHADYFSYIEFPIKAIQLWYLRGHLCLTSEL
jgi:hypothetical protein